MDYKDWIILRTIHEEKSLTSAAKKLFVSQPSLSYRIKKIEEYFGVKLFTINKKRVVLTPEGEYLVNYSYKMIHELQTISDDIKSMQAEVSGTLRIGVSSNFGMYVLPELLKEFSEKYPNVQFKLYTALSRDIMNLLNEDTVHVGIVRNNYDWHGEKYLMNVENLYIISSKQIILENLPNEKMIQYTTDESLQDTINNWWQENYQCVPNVEMELNRLGTCKEMVKNGFGFAIVPEICLKRNNEGLFIKKIYDQTGNWVERQTWLMYNNRNIEFNIVKHFVNHLKNWRG